ncbi:MAG: hypothetical protein NT099_10045 [Candidatus Saganbacteria bacterium]|nr:hypothetical protein [Candidatus Saganbacteria bacterium]
MDILISFAPWFLYWVFLSFNQIYLGMWLAFIAALILSLNELRKGKSKILQTGTLVFFFLMVLLITFTQPSWLWHEINLMGNLALALIALVSILIRKPFTLQYAMETTPKERWNTPEFMHGNMVITWAWFIAFIAMTIPSLTTFIGIEVSIWMNWVFSLCCFAGAMTFTNWYKKQAKKST